MKLFQRLLVAPAALGLISPLAANATEVNLNDISNYSDVESIELANSFESQLSESTLLAGGEGLSHSHDSDSFSETTTASFDFHSSNWNAPVPDGFLPKSFPCFITASGDTIKPVG